MIINGREINTSNLNNKLKLQRLNELLQYKFHTEQYEIEVIEQQQQQQQQLQHGSSLKLPQDTNNGGTSTPEDTPTPPSFNRDKILQIMTGSAGSSSSWLTPITTTNVNNYQNQKKTSRRTSLRYSRSACYGLYS